MHPHTQLTALCRRWSAAAPVSIAPLGTPGFSGSQVFVVELPDRPGPFVLKSFHAGASVEHARFVHGLVRHLRAEGIAEVPEVMPALDGDTVVVEADGRLWELARFMPGVAVPCPNPGQAAAATTTLARLHIAAAGLPDHPQHALAQRYMGGRASGILTFGVKGGRAAGEKFLDALKLVIRLVNIGDARSLATHPASTTHRQLSPAELAKAGVSEDMVRLSIGIEHIDDLKQDLDQALRSA